MKRKVILLSILLYSFIIGKGSEQTPLYVVKDVIRAVIATESGFNTKAYNPKEQAVGILQIRPIRVKDYNMRKGTNYQLKEFFNPELSIEMFLFYAKGKTIEKAVKDWNGSGPMTITYWNKVKTKMMYYNPQTYSAYKLMHEGFLAFSKAEQQGFRVDVEYLESKKVILSKKINRIESQFKDTSFYRHWEHTGKGKINIHSGQQLATFLYKTKKIEPSKTTESGLGSTDDEALSQLNIPELNMLLQARKLKKIRDTYLDGFLREQVGGVIHPFYNLHLVRTFRSSSDSPNFQNIPKRDEESMQLCRQALFPRENHQLMEIDFSGAEVRIAACYHKDPTMLNYINDPSSDMHRDMAMQLFELKRFDKKIESHATLRQAAKNGFVFPEFYGDYYKNCAVNLACSWGKLPQSKWKPGQGIEMPNGTLSDHLLTKNIKSIDDFTNHVKKIEKDFWENRFPKYAWWKDAWYDNYKKYGFIETLTGFTCRGFMGKNDAINYPVQGAAFHCLLWSFIETTKYIEENNLNSRVIGQIHDSMIIDTDPDEREDLIIAVKDIIINKLPAAWEWIIVPIDVEVELCPINGSWAEKEKYV